MRVPHDTLFRAIRGQISRNTESLFKAQERVATQRKINRMSDDPVAAGQVLRSRTTITQSEQFERNVGQAESLNNLYDKTMDGVIETLSRAKELMLGQASDISSSPQTREAARTELAALMGGLVSASNTRLGNEYIFSGFRSDAAAFLGPSASAAPDGANAGAGAVTSIGVFNEVEFTGDEYRIDIRDNAGNLVYDIFNVTRAIYVSTDTDYVSGDEIHFDGISATIADSPTPPADGDSFDVSTTLGGQYQGDNGQLQLEIEQDKRIVVNMTGDAVFQGAGLTGGVDLFDLFNRAIAALRANDGPEIENLLDEFDAGLRQTTSFQGLAGSRQSLLGEASSRLANLLIEEKNNKSELEDVDIAQAMTDLTQRETAFEASLNAASRLMVPSLLDFLR